MGDGGGAEGAVVTQEETLFEYYLCSMVYLGELYVLSVLPTLK